MGNVPNEMNKTRHQLRKVVGDSVNKNVFYTNDRDSKQVVRNEKNGNEHKIYKDGKLYKKHKD